MSILIKGMDMPTFEQGLRTINIYADGIVTNYAEETIGNAVPVQPHGRLIDADLFLALCKDYAITPSDVEFCNRLEYALTKAVTIIPASEDL